MQSSFDKISVDILIIWLETMLVLLMLFGLALTSIILLIKAQRLPDLYKIEREIKQIREDLDGKETETNKAIERAISRIRSLDGEGC